MKMTALKQLLATLGAFAFGTAAQSYIQPTQAQAPISEVELACERALNANSIEAIEYFLNRYPASQYGQTSCYAMALDALGQFNNDTEENTLGNNNDKNHGLYGG